MTSGWSFTWAALLVLGLVRLVQHPATRGSTPWPTAWRSSPPRGLRWGTYVSRRRLRPAWRNRTLRVRLLLLAWIGISALLLVYWMNRATGSQGRLIFPALNAGDLGGRRAGFLVSPLAAHLCTGAAWAVFPALLLGMTLYSVTLVIPAAYAAPAPVAAIPAPGAAGEHRPRRCRAHRTARRDARRASRRRSRRDPLPGRAGQARARLRVVHPTPRRKPARSSATSRATRVGAATPRRSGSRAQSTPTATWSRSSGADPDRVRRCWPASTPASSTRTLRRRTTSPSRRATQAAPKSRPCRRWSRLRLTPRPAARRSSASPAGILFGDAFQASALHAPAEISRGEAITLTVLWEATGRPAADYRLRASAGCNRQLRRRLRPRPSRGSLPHQPLAAGRPHPQPLCVDDAPRPDARRIFRLAWPL